ncbi:MAG: hypothetical protein R3E39_20565 [Anaerolineae bacterium]
MKFTIPATVLMILLAACQPAAPESAELPTLAALPSATATVAETATVEPTAISPSDTPPLPFPTAEASATEVLTNTPIPSRTPLPVTPTNTVEPTLAAIGTATQAVLEAPRFSTFTPSAPGVNPAAGTPQQMADVVVTEAQFQEEVNNKILAYPNLDSVAVDFVPSGIRALVTAYDGNGLTSGTVMVAIIMNGGVAAITITDISTGTNPVPQGYIDVATSDFFVMMVESLDSILKQRLGPEQDLQNLVVTDDEMQISLVVPQ